MITPTGFNQKYEPCKSAHENWVNPVHHIFIRPVCVCVWFCWMEATSLTQSSKIPPGLRQRHSVLMWDHCRKLMRGIIVILQMRLLIDAAIRHPPCPQFNHSYPCNASDLAPQTRLIHWTKPFFPLIFQRKKGRQEMSVMSLCISCCFIDILLRGPVLHLNGHSELWACGRLSWRCCHRCHRPAPQLCSVSQTRSHPLGA